MKSMTEHFVLKGDICFSETPENPQEVEMVRSMCPEARFYSGAG